MYGSTTTASPSVTEVTPEPTSATTPANSWPMTTSPDSPVSGCGSPGGGMKIGPSRYSCRSVPQMPHQSTLTFTVPGRTCGSGTSSMRMSSRAWNTAAFMGSLRSRGGRARRRRSGRGPGDRGLDGLGDLGCRLDMGHVAGIVEKTDGIGPVRAATAASAGAGAPRRRRPRPRWRDRRSRRPTSVASIACASPSSRTSSRTSSEPATPSSRLYRSRSSTIWRVTAPSEANRSPSTARSERRSAAAANPLR